jgi:hypothetical protein
MASAGNETHWCQQGRCGNGSAMRMNLMSSDHLATADYEQIELVANFCGLRLHRVSRVADIEHEV